MKRVLLLTLLAACGDNGKLLPDGGDQPDIDAAPGPARAIVVAGDFQTAGYSGVMSRLDIDGLHMTQNVAPAMSIGNDPVLRKLGTDLVVVNRDAGSVTILDAGTLMFEEQLSTGAGSNPQDVAAFGKKLFVPGLGTKGVVVLTRGETATTTIDLSSLDPDGKPDCVSAIRVGNEIYVACGLLDTNFQPRGNGKVVVIDGPSNMVKTTLTLSTPNPFGVLTELPDNKGLVIPTFQFGAPTARCLERIQTGTAPAAMGCMVQNADLGGFVVRATTQKSGTNSMLWLVVSDGGFPNEKARLRAYEMNTSTLWPDPFTPDTQVIGDVAACPDGKTVVADKTMAANGLRVYDLAVEQTTAPLAVGLRPQSSPSIVCY